MLLLCEHFVTKWRPYTRNSPTTCVQGKDFSSISSVKAHHRSTLTYINENIVPMRAAYPVPSNTGNIF